MIHVKTPIVEYKIFSLHTDNQFIMDEEDPLQINVLRPSVKDTPQKPHRHATLSNTNLNTDVPIYEAWIVFRGILHVSIYEIDGMLVDVIDLRAGDCFVMMKGYHKFTVSDNNTIFVEVKNGPFMPKVDL